MASHQSVSLLYASLASLSASEMTEQAYGWTSGCHTHVSNFSKLILLSCF